MARHHCRLLVGMDVVQESRLIYATVVSICFGWESGKGRNDEFTGAVGGLGYLYSYFISIYCTSIYPIFLSFLFFHHYIISNRAEYWQWTVGPCVALSNSLHLSGIWWIFNAHHDHQSSYRLMVIWAQWTTRVGRQELFRTIVPVYGMRSPVDRLVRL